MQFWRIVIILIPFSNKFLELTASLWFHRRHIIANNINIIIILSSIARILMMILYLSI